MGTRCVWVVPIYCAAYCVLRTEKKRNAARVCSAYVRYILPPLPSPPKPPRLGRLERSCRRCCVHGMHPPRPSPPPPRLPLRARCKPRSNTLHRRVCGLCWKGSGAVAAAAAWQLPVEHSCGNGQRCRGVGSVGEPRKVLRVRPPHGADGQALEPGMAGETQRRRTAREDGRRGRNTKLG